MSIIRTSGIVAALIAVVTAVSAPAQDAQNGQLINTPNVQDWSVYGDGQTHRVTRDGDVQGGGAMIVTIPAKPAHSWDIGASTPIQGAIRKGDALVFAFWAKLESGGDGGTTTIQAVVQQSAAPYAAAFSGDITVSGEWKLVHITGVSPQDFGPGEANGALSIGTARQTLALGPAFVLDLGPASAD
ncbi:hypothetical protein [Sphingosinithalassobacter portus]|uniref:hypothetical protein n=1 Tax=Stakelama portus TaxID=2676234 RepID=UPI000D6EA9C6|nr:hypothetical protein [Sphingosinithalassobacter portus]